MADKQIITKSQMIMRIAELSANIEAKEQECERLKEEAIKRSKELIRIRKERQEGQKMNRNLHQQLDQLKATNEDLLSIQYKLADNNKRLRQSLAEIKEIAEGYISYSTNAPAGGYKQILRKISECEVE